MRPAGQCPADVRTARSIAQLSTTKTENMMPELETIKLSWLTIDDSPSRPPFATSLNPVYRLRCLSPCVAYL